MTPRTIRSLYRLLLTCGLLVSCSPVGSSARGDALYSITALGTLPGTTQSIATGINGSGQIAGVSYNGSDGTWTAVGVLGPLGVSYDASARSFLYSDGEMTQINPVDGPANAINSSGQVVGGHYSSINDIGQYVGGGASALAYEGQYSMPGQLVSNGTTSTLNELGPFAINNAGTIVGFSSGAALSYQNGQVTDLSSEFHLNGKADAAYAISNSGYALISEGLMGGSSPVHYLLLNPTGYNFNGATGPSVTDLTDLVGGSGKIALALNDLGQVVGNGFLYSGGQFLSLQGLLPAPSSSQWSNLVATAINDKGQIVGQGTFNGQRMAFEMAPNAADTPEPTSVLIFGLGAALLGFREIVRRRGGRRASRLRR